eukprot:3777235-Rhodomonas_salina.3
MSYSKKVFNTPSPAPPHALVSQTIEAHSSPWSSRYAPRYLPFNSAHKPCTHGGSGGRGAHRDKEPYVTRGEGTRKWRVFLGHTWKTATRRMDKQKPRSD